MGIGTLPMAETCGGRIRTTRGRHLLADMNSCVAEDETENVCMKLVTTSLAVSTIILSLCGAAIAQTSLDPNAQGRSRSNIGVPPAEGHSGASGSATTGAGVKSKSGAGVSGDVSGQGSVGGGAGAAGGGAGIGASGKARSNTLGN
jgi:hypothetical protein